MYYSINLYKHTATIHRFELEKKKNVKHDIKKKKKNETIGKRARYYVKYWNWLFKFFS